MVKKNEKELQRLAKHSRIRKKMVGTPERLRLCVHRSLKNLYAQVVDDTTGRVMFGMSTLNKKVVEITKKGGNVEAAGLLGKVFAEEAKGKGLVRLCFDRGGYKYHGRVKAFAEAAREGGLDF